VLETAAELVLLAGFGAPHNSFYLITHSRGRGKAKRCGKLLPPPATNPYTHAQYCNYL